MLTAEHSVCEGTVADPASTAIPEAEAEFKIEEIIRQAAPDESAHCGGCGSCGGCAH